jgi:hypothetical protein
LKENVEETTKNLNVFRIVGMDQMEQRSIFRLLRLKGLSKKAIHRKFAAVLQENAVSYLNMTRFGREAVLDLNSEEALSAILATLRKYRSEAAGHQQDPRHFYVCPLSETN